MPARGSVDDADRAGVDHAVVVLVGGTERRVGVPVAVEVTGGDGRAEPVVLLADARHARGILANPLRRSAEAARAAVQDRRLAGLDYPVIGCARRAHHEIGVPVGVEVAGRDREAETTRVRRAGVHLRAGRADPVSRSVQHDHAAGAVREVIRGAHRDIGVAVAVEPADRDRPSEAADLSQVARYARRRLVEVLGLGRVDAATAAVVDLDRSRPRAARRFSAPGHR